MAWERRVRLLSWVFFALMWLPLGFVISAAMAETEEPPMAALFLFFGLCILFSVLQIGSFGVGWYERGRIKKRGVPVKATIVSVSDTGTMINDQPLLRIELDIQPPYDSQFRTSVEYVVPYSFLPQVQPGNTLLAYYIENTKEVALADL
jgi:hypothetical protein